MVASAIVLGTLFLLSGFLALAASAGSGSTSNGGGSPAYSYAIVQFAPAAVADYTGGIAGLAATQPLHGHKLDLASAATVQYEAYLSTVHADYRAWLKANAPWAQIVREFSVTFDGFAVALNGNSMSSLQNGPGVASVTQSWLYQPSMDVSVPLIKADTLWSALGVDLTASPAAYGVLPEIKVGVIDTGILDTHPFIASCRATNPVVHRGLFFSGLPFGIPIVGDHGTHVAGTIGGCMIPGPVQVGTTSLDLASAVTGKTSGFMSGVAPGVSLFDYNVFPGMGVGFYIKDGSAFSQDIMAAVEQAVLDGMDVINLSLGGGVQGPHDLLADAINAAVDAGTIAVVAAGNSGPGTMTVESPGSAANAITAGASANPHYMGIHVTLTDAGFGSLTGTVVGAALGDFKNFDPAITAAIGLPQSGNELGCNPITADLTGKIAVIKRGTCTFGTKIQNAETAGAVGTLVVNSQSGDPTAMGGDGVHHPTIPAAMVSKADGAALLAANGLSIKVDGTVVKEIVTSNQDYLASFSSRGPTPYTFLIKPDVTAPGVNVLSSIFTLDTSTGTPVYTPGWAFFQGTSMATPHITGSVALLLASHPTWSPAEVKSALVNTADRTVKDPSTGALLKNPNSRGGGRIDLASASATPATLAPASVSFGLWTGSRPIFSAMGVILTNEQAGTITCSLSVSSPFTLPAGTISVAPSSLSLPAGGVGAFTVTLNGGQTLGQGFLSAFYYGDVKATCGSTDLLAPWFVAIQRSNGGLNGNMASGLSIPGDDAIASLATPVFTASAWIE